MPDIRVLDPHAEAAEKVFSTASRQKQRSLPANRGPLRTLAPRLERAAAHTGGPSSMFSDAHVAGEHDLSFFAADATNSARLSHTAVPFCGCEFTPDSRRAGRSTREVSYA